MKRRIFLWMGLSVLFLSSVFCTEGFSKETYQVKQGSTLFTIAKKYGITVAELKKANNIRGNALKPGQILTIPDRKGTGVAKTDRKAKAVAKGKTAPVSKSNFYVVKKGDSIYGISKKTGVSIAEIKRINHLRGNALKPGRKLAIARHETGKSVAQDDVASSKKPSAFDLDDDDLEEDDGVAAVDDPAEIEKEKAASSNLLGMWNNPEEPRLLVKVVKGFLGTPYRLGGSSVRGIDCSAFVAKIYEFFDVNLPRTAREQARVGQVVSKEELVEGDLVFFNTRRRAFGHVGIYIGNNEFIHASSGRSSKAVRIDNLDKPYYHKRFIKAVRLKGIDDKAAQMKGWDGKV